jgi:hypothetical protein
MDVAAITSAAERLAGASPREAHDLVIANPWLLDSGADDAIADQLTRIRRQGDGPRAERLEWGRTMLQRCREYGADRVLVRDVLDQLETLSPTELTRTMQIVPAEELQGELRRRIDGSLDIGDVLAWNHWLTVSIALEQAGGPNPLHVAVPAIGDVRDDVEHDADWAARFLDEHDRETQRAMLRDGPLPLPQSRLEQVRLRLRFEHLLAARDRDALEVIRLRRSLAMAQVAAAADETPELVEEVLAGRKEVFVKGIIL